MAETFIFDIPIYRVAEAKYYTAQNEYIEDRLYANPGLSRGQMEAFYKEYPDRKTRERDYLWRKYGGPWRFNDAVGYIRLYLEGYEVRGQLWYVNAKRILRKPKHKRIFCKSTKFGLPVAISSDSSNAEILNGIMKYIESVRPHFKTRFIDISLLEQLGPYIDWKSLIEENIPSGSSVSLETRRS